MSICDKILITFYSVFALGAKTIQIKLHKDEDEDGAGSSVSDEMIILRCLKDAEHISRIQLMLHPPPPSSLGQVPGLSPTRDLISARLLPQVP